MESMSGETYRPHQRRSSPVFTTNVISSAGMTWRRPSTNLAPPVPPVRTQIMPPSGRNLQDRWRLQVFPQAALAWPAQREETRDTPADAAAVQTPWPGCAGEAARDAARVFPG